MSTGFEQRLRSVHFRAFTATDHTHPYIHPPGFTKPNWIFPRTNMSTQRKRNNVLCPGKNPRLTTKLQLNPTTKRTRPHLNLHKLKLSTPAEFWRIRTFIPLARPKPHMWRHKQYNLPISKSRITARILPQNKNGNEIVFVSWPTCLLC